jgi:hypothetical protein
MKKTDKPDPPNVGRIVCYEDLTAVKFWVRIFGLERVVTLTQAKIQEHLSGRKRGVMPIINEYRAGEDLFWLFILVLDVDVLGLSGGTAIVWYTDKAHEAEVRANRDKWADDLLKSFHEHKGDWDEIIELEPRQEQL